MLVNLELTNFRKHTDTKVLFTGGLNVIRGPNEGGKTTLIEAALYALYGTKSLRDPLAKTVTWGSKESTLKVKLEIQIGDGFYTFTRSKSGAECNGAYGPPTETKLVKVTGQAEVSAYAATLLGADAKTAAMLMLSSQSGIRGALDEGPTAVSGLMGKLADFDLIDRIVEAAAQSLLLGSEVPTQAKLDAALGDVAECKLLVDVPSPVAAMDAEIAELHAKRVQVQAATDAQQLLMVECNDRINNAKSVIAEHGRTVQSLASLEVGLMNDQAKLDAAKIAAADMPNFGDIEGLRTRITTANSHQTLVNNYKLFTGLPKYPEVFWDEGMDSLNAEVVRLTGIAQAASMATATLQGECLALTKARITSGKCPTCGHAALGDDHVANHNDHIDKQISALRATMAEQVLCNTHAMSELADMNAVIKSAKPFTNLYVRLGDLLIADASFFPVKLTWAGATPKTPEDVGQLQSKLSNLEQKQRNSTLAEGMVAHIVDGVSKLQLRILEVKKTLESSVVPDIEPLNIESTLLFETYSTLMCQGKVCQTRLDVLVPERDAVRWQEQLSRDALILAESRVSEYMADIKTLAFNNALVSKLRKLKPTITDHLWNVVLAAVSTYFSQMRGEVSVVTKDADGFKVNGESVTSFSGSTLDVLALAIRVALTKTFIPHASFLVLDEPASGCDNNRTGNLLGFLSSVGFQQTILASHDELSESVADNVILLGE